ncbi:MAG: hypothetical protein MK010_08915, partial [Erythrobacter sp.]|nr:hypothetical protein [Erythrobacter sp.]
MTNKSFFDATALGLPLLRERRVRQRGGDAYRNMIRNGSNCGFRLSSIPPGADPSARLRCRV